MSDDLVCWKCGVSLDDIPRPLSRYQPCRRCGADLYVCRMCIHYDPRWNNACREERAEAPRSKETANFCDFFAPGAGMFRDAGAQTQKAQDALAALFGGGQEASSAQTPARDALEALFSKEGKSDN